MDKTINEIQELLNDQHKAVNRYLDALKITTQQTGNNQICKEICKKIIMEITRLNAGAVDENSDYETGVSDGIKLVSKAILPEIKKIMDIYDET